MDYYKSTAQATKDLAVWIGEGSNRSNWQEFCRVTVMKYGFSPKKMRLLLDTFWPRFTIDELGVLIEVKRKK